MRILFCIGSLNRGGAERVIANLANFFSGKNECTIVTTISDSPKYELKKNINCYSLDEKNNLYKGKMHRNIKRVMQLNKIINKINPEIIISFLPEPSYRVLLLRIFNKIPVIISVRNDPKIEYHSLINKILMNVLYPLADGFVFQTREAQEYFKKSIKNKSVIIPNPLKNEFVKRKMYDGEREKTIVTVGRLEKQKNHKLLINAYNEIKNEIEDFNLVIYGEGSLRSELEEQIKSLKLDNRVKLPGIIENVPEKIEKATLFILTSDYEGMPNALMEAMALGIPCIATDCPCGGCKEIIESNVNGKLIKTKSIGELKKSILEILKDDQKRTTMGYKAMEIRKKFDPNKINNKWNNYINKILKTKNRMER